MPGAVDQPLRVERPVAERARRLRRAPGEGLGDLGFAAHRAHAASAAARHGLEHDRRVAQRRKTRAHLRRSHDRALDHRRPARAAISRASTLSPKRSSASGDGPTNVSPAGHDGAGETCVLGEKAVAGMDRVAAGGAASGDDARAVEIGGRARARQAHAPRPPCADATRPRRPRSRSRRSRSRDRPPRGRRGRQSRHGWR